MCVVCVRLGGIAEAQHKAGGRANVLPPVDRLVKIGRVRLHAVEVDLISYNSCGHRSYLAVDFRRKTQHELNGIVEAVRVEAGIQINGAVDHANAVI